MTMRSLSFCATAFAAAGSTPLLAAEASMKVLAENDKFQIVEIIRHPGDTGRAAVWLGNRVYIVSGGIFERAFADGTKEVMPHRSGDAIIIQEKRAYSVRNVGTTTIHLIEFLSKK